MKVNKTVKLYIGGSFPRTESGRSYPISYHQSEKVYAHVCQSSRKDFRNAVAAAKKASPWSERTQYNKSQIIYRMAEMLESKRSEFNQLFIDVLGLTEEKADQQTQSGIDALVYYAGWADKFQQVAGSINPVNGPFHNFCSPTPQGVITLVASEEFSFSQLVGDMASIILGGNTLVILLSNSCAPLLAPLAEVLETSDLPGGVVNLLTGYESELAEILAGHREVGGLILQSEGSSRPERWHDYQLKGAENMKRVNIFKPDTDPLEKILKTVEFQTVWHPVGV